MLSHSRIIMGLLWDQWYLWSVRHSLSSSTLPEVHHIASDTHRLKRLQSGNLQTEHSHCYRNWNGWLRFMEYCRMSADVWNHYIFTNKYTFRDSIKIIQRLKFVNLSTQWNCKTVALLVAFSHYCLLKGFISFIRRQVNMRRLMFDFSNRWRPLGAVQIHRS